jgi:hypothetical protein
MLQWQPRRGRTIAAARGEGFGGRRMRGNAKGGILAGERIRNSCPFGRYRPLTSQLTSGPRNTTELSRVLQPNTNISRYGQCFSMSGR